LIVDDLPSAGRASAAALLADLRSVHTEHVLTLLAARPGQLGRLGDAWSRFAAGDHRCDRLISLARSVGLLTVTWMSTRPTGQRQAPR